MGVIFSLPYLFWLVASAISFGVGEYFSKKFGLSPNWPDVAAMFFFYMLGVVFWLPAIIEKNQLSIAGAIWSVLSLIGTVLIGVLLFSEKLSVVGIIGILFGIASVYLLSIA